MGHTTSLYCPKIVLMLFTSLNQARTVSPKCAGTKFKFFTSNCFKYHPNKHIFSHLEPIYSAYPTKLHLLATDKTRPTTVAFQSLLTYRRLNQLLSNITQTHKAPLLSPSPLGGPFPYYPLAGNFTPDSGRSLAGRDLPSHTTLSKHDLIKCLYVTACPGPSSP